MKKEYNLTPDFDAEKETEIHGRNFQMNFEKLIKEAFESATVLGIMQVAKEVGHFPEELNLDESWKDFLKQNSQWVVHFYADMLKHKCKITMSYHNGDKKRVAARLTFSKE